MDSIKGSDVREVHKGYPSDEGGGRWQDYPPEPESARKLLQGYRDRLTEYISRPVGKLPLTSSGQIPISGRIMCSEGNGEAPGRAVQRRNQSMNAGVSILCPSADPLQIRLSKDVCPMCVPSRHRFRLSVGQLGHVVLIYKGGRDSGECGD